MDGNTIRLLIFISVFVLMLVLEMLIPRHPTVDSKSRRIGIHLGLSGLNTLLLKLVFGAAAVGAAKTFEIKGWGLLNILDWNNVVEFFLTSGKEALYVYALISSDCGLFLYAGLFLPTVLIFFKATSKFVLIPLSKNLPKAV